MRFTKFAAILTLALFAACSSAPPAPIGIQDRKNRAADYLKFGQQAFQEAQYDQALSFYLFAVDLNTAVDFETGMAAAWNSVATAQDALGHHAEALAALAQAEVLAQSSGDKTVILQVAANRVQSLLADGNNTEAQTRLTALKPFPATAEGAALEHAWGTLEKALDHPDEAMAAFDRALAVNKNLGLRQEMAANQFMKASVQARMSQWALAQVSLNAALEYDKSMENTLGIGQDLRALGTVALKLEQTQQAFDYYVRAYRLFVAAQLPVQQKKTIELLLPVAASLGLAEEQKRYQALLDAFGLP